MDPFSYLSVLISIVLALGMTRALSGVGDMLQARSHRRIYRVHAVWIVNLFLYLVVAWWIFHRWRNQQTWTFFLFVFVLTSPTILYLASLLLFPREGDVDLAVDYKTIIMRIIAPSSFFSHCSRRLMLLTAYSKAPAIFLNQDRNTPPAPTFYFAGLVTAAITRNERYHQFYAVFFLVQTVVISFVIFHTLV